jgi:cell fate regulator YaaT (PSP1 superfamily)
VTDGDDAPEGGDEPAAAAEGEGGERRRRRRRRRRGEGGGDPQQGQGQGQPSSQPQPQQPPRERPPQQQQRERQPQQPRERQPQQQQRERQPQQQQRERQPQQQQQPRQERGRRGERRDGERRDGDRDRDRRDARPAPSDPRPTPTAELPAPRLEHRRGPDTGSAGDEPDDDTSGVAWGTDDPGPAAAITLGADLPADPPEDDLDPTSAHVVSPDEVAGAVGADAFADLVNMVGVRLASAGRIYWCDAHDHALVRGDRVIVEGEKGPRLATVAVDARLQPTRDRDQKLRRVTRRATAADLRVETDAITAGADLLRVAKQRVRELRIPAKVFRVERYGSGHRGGRVVVYYTSDERIELRELVRELGTATGARVELRQIGVRDEAKLVGGIGSCGLELCCTTWLPEFVPVSIKMAKDQGMVLSPTKVSGQCGRLKCCLVYEQATYAELRKGLPKLGKRVITARGEGRVVEVDVLRGRVRVGYGPGDSEVLAGGDVKPMFPSGGPGGGRISGSQDAIDPAEVLDAADDPSLRALADTDDPSAVPSGDDLD